MSDTQTSSRQKIRTFAQDLDTMRKQREAVTEPKKKKNVPAKPTPASEPTPKAAAPAPVHKASAPKPIPKPPVIKPKKVPPAKPKTPAPIPKKLKADDRPIPAFHELQRTVNSIQESGENTHSTDQEKTAQKPIKKPKHLKQTQRPNIGYDATVIRDTKRHDFQLFPSMAKSIKKWFASLTKKKTPKYAIPETSRRKGVIQKATSKSGTVFSANNEQIREQVRRRQKQAKQKPVVEEPVETSWSPFTDTGYNLLEQPAEPKKTTTENVQLEFKRPIHRKVKAEKEAAAPVPDTTEPETTKRTLSTGNQNAQLAIETDENRWAATATEPDTTDFASQPETQFSESFIAPPSPEETVSLEVTSEEEGREPAEPNISIVEYPDSSLHRFDTNTLTIIFFLIVIGGLLAILVGRVVYMNMNPAAPTVEKVTIITETKSILANTTTATITLSNDTISTFPTLVKAGVAEAPVGFVELAVTSPLGDVVSPSYIFELLQFRTVPSLRHSITTVRFVTVNQSTPTVLLQFVDKDTVHGGMLTWERTLAEDMRTLYDIPTSTEGLFIDETIGEIDVRVLRIDEEVELIYGFVGQSTLLISSSVDDFTQIVQLGFSD